MPRHVKNELVSLISHKMRLRRALVLQGVISSLLITFLLPRLTLRDYLARIFGGGATRSCDVSPCVYRYGTLRLRVFASTCHGRTNAVVMGVVVQHQRIATH